MSVTSHHIAPGTSALHHPLRRHAITSANNSAGQQVFIVFACVFCGLILTVDVLGEAYAAIIHSASALDWGHIVIELLATCLLYAAAKIAYTQMRTLKAAAEKSDEQLYHLRSEFDIVLHERFAQWNLSKSEVDVALLTIRGLSICRIAEMRHTQQGTIKAQLSAIFRKAGVSSRTELLAMFMDELLDFGSQPHEKGHLLEVAS